MSNSHTYETRKPKSFFDGRLNALRLRLSNLKHFLSKVSDSKKKCAIEAEINSTEINLKRTELDSNFARLD